MTTARGISATQIYDAMTNKIATQRAEELMQGKSLTRQEMRECIRDLLQEIKLLKIEESIHDQVIEECGNQITELEQLNKSLEDQNIAYHELHCAYANEKEALTAELAECKADKEQLIKDIETDLCDTCWQYEQTALDCAEIANDLYDHYQMGRIAAKEIAEAIKTQFNIKETT